MKITIITGIRLLVLLSVALKAVELKAQDSLPKPPVHHQSAPSNQGQRVYQTPIAGWMIRPGDTLQLGRGSGTDKAFAFLYQADTTGSVPVTKTNRQPLPAEHAGRKVVIQELIPTESGAAGFNLDGVTAGRGQKPYRIELGKAINAGELLPPIQYRPSAQAAPGLPVVGAQQLVNLKALLDAGQIKRAEYDRRRKKLLEKQ